MFSEKLLDHFQNPRNAGELPAPALCVEVTNAACGDVLRLSVRVEEGRVEAARFLVRGCTAAMAAGSALTVLLVGRGRAALGAVDAGLVEEELGGLAAGSRHAAVLCADAVREILRRLPPPAI